MTDPRNWAGSMQDEPELFVVPLSKESLEQNKPKPNPTLMRVCQRGKKPSERVHSNQSCTNLIKN